MISNTHSDVLVSDNLQSDELVLPYNILSQNSNECRYCFELCKENVSMCKCKGNLCQLCFNKELQLTKKRNSNNLECTVCKTKYSYFYETSIDNWFIKYLTCKKICIPTMEIYYYNNLPIEYKILIIMYVIIMLLYSIWSIQFTLFKKNETVSSWFIIIDFVSFVILFAIHNKTSIYLTNKFPYLLIIIMGTYISKPILLILILTWESMNIFTKASTILEISFCALIFLYLMNIFINKIMYIHNNIFDRYKNLYVYRK